MIKPGDRKDVVDLINEAVQSGSRLIPACTQAEICTRTYERWVKGYKENNEYIDKRTIADHSNPHNKLTNEEKAQVLEIIIQPEYQSLPPSQIVPMLADEGIYVASESTFYRIMRENNLQNHRDLTKKPEHRSVTTHKAIAPNQVYVWDITYLNGPIKGLYYYLYLILDIFSRKIVAWEIWEEESAENASQLIRRAIISEKITSQDHPLVLHSDNGSPMKGATMLETLYNLGITPSRSRPRVSNDNAYAETIFKTLKYRCNYQPKGFKTIFEARMWVMKFANWYNNEHRHSGINFLTPNQRHSNTAGRYPYKQKKCLSTC